MSDKISILLPTRNRSRMLKERAIPTVLGQSHENWELLVVGDCCIDDTEEVVKSFNDPRIKFFNLPEKIYHYPKDDAKAEWLAGPVYALNKALEMVTGDYIARLDDDDIWMDYHLKKSLSFLRHYDYEFVSSVAIAVENGVARQIAPYFINANTSKAIQVGSVQTWLYSAEYESLKYNPECWHRSWNANNEVDWYLRLYEECDRFGYAYEYHALVLPRPGLTTIGSRAYIQERNELQK